MKRSDEACAAARASGRFVLLDNRNNPLVKLSESFERGRPLKSVTAEDEGSCRLVRLAHTGMMFNKIEVFLLCSSMIVSLERILDVKVLKTVPREFEEVAQETVPGYRSEV
jgi:hypothetical protein